MGSLAVFYGGEQSHNDIDDLLVDLKVMNQLIRSQGFGAKHD
ncbi:hypothetical protein [Photorhabdus hindustanensis]|nr:hypothetical protein [Photorhabdus hindustanensis]